MASTSKKTGGRRKVEMVRIKNDSHRRVTFTKRYAGIFKKASELCTLCGVEVAIIVFSPGKRAFSFGHPSVEMIIKRLSPSISSSSSNNSNMTEPFTESQINEASVVALNKELTILNNTLEMEKKRGEEIDEIKKAREEQCYWWNYDNQELTLEQLVYLESSFEVLKNNVIQQANFLKMVVEIISNASVYPSMENNNPMEGFYNEAPLDN